jgi:hypothetical protein
MFIRFISKDNTWYCVAKSPCCDVGGLIIPLTNHIKQRTGYRKHSFAIFLSYKSCLGFARQTLGPRLSTGLSLVGQQFA